MENLLQIWLGGHGRLAVLFTVAEITENVTEQEAKLGIN